MWQQICPDSHTHTYGPYRSIYLKNLKCACKKNKISLSSNQFGNRSFPWILDQLFACPNTIGKIKCNFRKWKICNATAVKVTQCIRNRNYQEHLWQLLSSSFLFLFYPPHASLLSFCFLPFASFFLFVFSLLSSLFLPSLVLSSFLPPVPQHIKWSLAIVSDVNLEGNQNLINVLLYIMLHCLRKWLIHTQ